MTMTLGNIIKFPNTYHSGGDIDAGEILQAVQEKFGTMFDGYDIHLGGNFYAHICKDYVLIMKTEPVLEATDDETPVINLDLSNSKGPSD